MRDDPYMTERVERGEAREEEGSSYKMKKTVTGDKFKERRTFWILQVSS